jgi:hypothetical protein
VRFLYDLTLDIELFLGSYIAYWNLLIFAGLGLVLLLFQYSPAVPGWLRFQRAREFLRANWRSVGYRAAVVLVVAGLVAEGMRRTAPAQVTRIRVQFLDRPPDLRKDATSYLVYELNRRQKSWQFEFLFKDFNSDALTSQQLDRLLGDEQRTLSIAEIAANAEPYVALTRESLGPSRFWVHRGPVSVISTQDRVE